MGDDRVPQFEFFDDEDNSPRMMTRAYNHATETIDLHTMISELDDFALPPGTEKPQGIQATAFGKIMEALPIPAILVDRSFEIIFVNESCGKISPDYEHIRGSGLASLFDDPGTAKKALGLVTEVLSSSKSQMIEAVLRLRTNRIWGRMHMRSIRFGQDRSVLILVEDLTLERKQLVLQRKLQKQLEERVEARTAELRAINHRLQQEVAVRKQAEEELRSSETRYRMLANNFPNGFILLLDRDLRHVVADGSGLSTLGLSKEEMEGTSIWDVFPMEVSSILESRVRATLEGRAQVYELPFNERILESRTLPIKNDLDEVVAVMVMTQDITARKHAEDELKKHRQHLEELVAERTEELISSIKRLKKEVRDRKQAEELLRASERRLTVAFSAIPGSVSISTPKEGRYVEVNETFCRLFGYTRDDVIGRTVPELKTWARLEHREQMVRTVMDKGSISDFEAVFRSKNGKLFVGSLSGKVIEVDGQPFVLAIVMDITDRKKAERERTRMTTAIEQAGEGILITDERGMIKYANPSLLAISGYAYPEIRGQNMSLLRCSDNDRNVLNEAKIKLKLGEPWKGRLFNQKKDGTRYEVETTISPVRGQSGKVINFVFVERDVTNEVRLERQLLQAQKMQAIGTLAGGIAHDFNNILMAMMGYCEMAKKSIPRGSRAVADLNHVLKAGDRARELIKQILAFSRKSEHELRPVEVQLVFKETVKLLRASIPATIQIRQEIDPNAGAVLGDPTQMHQVIMNLCTNAYQSMEGRHGVLSVILAPECLDERTARHMQPDLKPGEYVRLTVSDTGDGIAPDIVERIFDPYFTTKGQGKGTGMGLAVVHGIVTGHGGTITVRSELGKGTTFTVLLPRYSGTAAAVEVESCITERGTGHILLVDDEATLADLGKRVLESLGYSVTAVTQATAARTAFEDRPGEFDLVITDLTMPNMTGLELAKELMAIRPEVPVILCTGSGDAVNRDAVRDAGIRDYLIKPVLPNDFGRVVHRVLCGNTQDTGASQA